MAINYQDPRFQRRLLEAQAKKGTSAMVSTRKLTEEFAKQEQDVHMQFQKMGIRKYIADKELDLRHKSLMLDEKFLAANDKLFKQGMANKEDELFYGLVGGLGTSIFAALEGRRRREEKKKTARMIYNG